MTMGTLPPLPMLAPSGWSQQSKSADIRQRSFANERVKKFWIGKPGGLWPPGFFCFEGLPSVSLSDMRQRVGAV
jgi:hypothetical protein